MKANTIPTLSKRRDRCRLCNGPHLELVLPLTPTPVADHFVTDIQKSGKQQVFPLDLHMCGECGHVQLLEVVNPQHLFENYTYQTTTSPGLVEHFRQYADSVCTRFSLASKDLVVDIGSNTGSFLQFFKDRQCSILGIDPALQIARSASERGIPTRAEFFTSQGADRIISELGQAKLITANNVFAHADDLSDMAEGISKLLLPEGIFIFEVNHLVDIVQNMLFDTVYHEHLCYHSLRPLIRFFERFDLEVFDVHHSKSKGGSIRVFTQKRGGRHAVNNSVQETLAHEESLKIHNPATWQKFTSDIQIARSTTLREILGIKKSGARIVGFGASPTVTTLLYHFGLAEYLEYLIDDNSNRHGLYSPGHHLPVYSPNKVYEDGIESIIILAWRYHVPIRKNHSSFTSQGGQFIVPLPSYSTF